MPSSVAIDPDWIEGTYTYPYITPNIMHTHNYIKTQTGSY